MELGSAGQGVHMYGHKAPYKAGQSQEQEEKEREPADQGQAPEVHFP